MSLQATCWVIRGQHGAPAHLRMVLMCLADHADEHGRTAYPSVRTLALYVGKCERQVRADLRDLKALGLLTLGNQLAVAHLPADRRPVVYDLPLGLKVTEAVEPVVCHQDGVQCTSGHTPLDDQDGVQCTSVEGPNGVQSTAYKPSLKAEPPLTTSSSAIVRTDEPTTSMVKDGLKDRPDVEWLCRYLASKVENNCSRRPEVTKRWRTQCRLLIDKDGRDPRLVRELIDFATSDPFWSQNCMSMPTLREHADRFVAAVRNGSSPNGKASWREENRAILHRAMARAEANDAKRGGDTWISGK